MSSLPAARLSRSPLSLALLALLAPTAHATGTDADGQTKPTDIDKVQVVGQRYLPDYTTRQTRSATKTPTPLLDIPQAVAVVTDKLIADQAMTSLAETLRYMPGIGVAQGEGNRDTPVLRGNSSTADFFVDGVRDDVQYIRDVYNLERAEALKGANAMIFGRGGSGGVINRVTRQADGMEHRAGTLQFGADQRKRTTLDFGSGIGDGTAGFRVNAMYEDSEGFRDGYQLERYGINPTFGIDLGANTRLNLSYEHFHDERVADRGVPSLGGRPLATDPSTFFGNPDASPVAATIDAFAAVIDHEFGNGLQLRNHLRGADYDKFYQNVYPGAVDAVAKTVSISAYNQATQRRNLFNQTDLVWAVASGGISHTLLAGAEFGRQVTDNLRLTGYFGAPGSNVASVNAPLSAPTIDLASRFRPAAGDADNHGVATVAALYVQDQIELSPRWQAIVGLRYDDFRVTLRNNRTGADLRSDDDMLAPRAGLLYKPRENLSLYASYSMAYQPRAGEQLASLSAITASLEPETFRNRELGAKWDLRPHLQASIALYQLKRGNVAITDPADATRMLLVDGQSTEGVEIGIAGHITDAWQVMGGYAWQAGEYQATAGTSMIAGNRLSQLPRHSASLWNRYDFDSVIGAGIGIIHRGAVFAAPNNAVTLPAFTRFDAALYWTLNPSMQLQLNVENLGNKRYWASAHNNDNISPGAPRSAWISINYRY